MPLTHVSLIYGTLFSYSAWYNNLSSGSRNLPFLLSLVGSEAEVNDLQYFE
jgi:hypothetical protein